MAIKQPLTFGQLLRRFRRAAGLTQEVLAEQAGINVRTISDLERGLYQRPHRDTVQLLADALGLGAEDRRILESPGGRGTRSVEETTGQGEGRHPIGDTASATPQRIGTVAGILTFLIADIRGYTRFTLEQGDEAAARLAGAFGAVAEEIAVARAGEVIELRGDEALLAFVSARQALHAALDLQQRFAQEMEADPSLPLQVGIGLDAGEAIPVKGGYRGAALNLAARLCSIAGAGEVFCSETVIGLARKTAGIAFVDRGEITLKGLIGPVRVIQIAPEGALPENLTPLQTILVTHPNNLPDEPTPFIGREREIEQITGLLQDPHVRMVTLTGPGGAGKTRLALQVGNTLLHDFADGVFFVNLAPLSDPALVPSAIAEVLRVTEQAGTDLVDTLADHFGDKHLLLVLDNYEHLLAATPVVASLLDGCRRLHMLVTSRMPLHLSREHEHAVPPLSVPDPRHLPDPESLSQYESVALFIERARAAQDTFQVTNDNAPAVAEICSRLDGLPLAIELAAARIKLFPPQALLHRLSSRLKVLTGGAKDRPNRQQTLRNTLDWSYSLLSPDEQHIFARLSVFAGGCTFEAAEVVCNPEGETDLLEGLAGLVDKSLVQQRGVAGEPRFRMLETIKEYAGEKLAERGEEETLRSIHAAYFTALSEQAEPELRGPEQVAWLARLEQDHENLRAVLSWCVRTGNELGLRLAGALFWFWYMRGHFSEGRAWLEAMLTAGHESEQDTGTRIKVLHGAGNLATQQDDYDRAGKWLEESLRLARGVGDTRGIATSLRGLALVAALRDDIGRAKELYEESLQLSRELGDRLLIALGLTALGQVVEVQGDYVRSTELHEESLQLKRELGDIRGIAVSINALGKLASYQDDFERAEELLAESMRMAQDLRSMDMVAGSSLGLGVVALLQRDYERAKTLFEESLHIWRELGDQWLIACGLSVLGLVASGTGDAERAEEMQKESLRICRTLGSKYGIARPFTGLAGVAALRQEHERAAQFLGVADAIWTSIGVAPDPCYRLARRDASRAARTALRAEAYQAAWQQGQATSLEEAVANALGEKTRS